MTQVASHRRHDISEQGWGLLDPRLPGPRGQLGRHSQEDSRQFGSCASVRHGVTYRRITTTGTIRTGVWRNKGVWAKLLEIPIDEPDYEWLMIDASHGKVHASGARGDNQEMSRTKGGSTQNRVWPHRACRLLHKVQEQIVKRQTA